MCNWLMQRLLVAAIGLASGVAGIAAPKPIDNAPTEKEIKEFATKVVTALIEKDIDGFMRMTEVPFHQPGGYFWNEKEDLNRWIKKALDDEPFSKGVNEIKSIKTFEATKASLSEAENRSFNEALGEQDFVVCVNTEFGGRKKQLPLLIKIKSGKPRLVGWGIPH